MGRSTPVTVSGQRGDSRSPKLPFIWLLLIRSLHSRGFWSMGKPEARGNLSHLLHPQSEPFKGHQACTSFANDFWTLVINSLNKLDTFKTTRPKHRVPSILNIRK